MTVDEFKQLAHDDLIEHPIDDYPDDSMRMLLWVLLDETLEMSSRKHIGRNDEEEA